MDIALKFFHKKNGSRAVGVRAYTVHGKGRHKDYWDSTDTRQRIAADPFILLVLSSVGDQEGAYVTWITEVLRQLVSLCLN
jgi:hypothetical protein